MKPDFEDFFQYVFGGLTEVKRRRISTLLEKDPYQAAIVDGLYRLKEYYRGDVEKVRAYLDRMESETRDRFFPPQP